jgi:hypothetical protein
VEAAVVPVLGVSGVKSALGLLGDEAVGLPARSGEEPTGVSAGRVVPVTAGVPEVAGTLAGSRVAGSPGLLLAEEAAGVLAGGLSAFFPSVLFPLMTCFPNQSIPTISPPKNRPFTTARTGIFTDERRGWIGTVARRPEWFAAFEGSG